VGDCRFILKFIVWFWRWNCVSLLLFWNCGNTGISNSNPARNMDACLCFIRYCVL